MFFSKLVSTKQLWVEIYCWLDTTAATLPHALPRSSLAWQCVSDNLMGSWNSADHSYSVP